MEECEEGSVNEMKELLAKRWIALVNHESSVCDERDRKIHVTGRLFIGLVGDGLESCVDMSDECE